MTHDRRWLSAWLAAACLALTTPLAAQETRSPPAAVMTVPPGAELATEEPPPVPPYTIHARVFVGAREMWAGYLAMTDFGHAYVRTHVQDMDAACPRDNDRFKERRHTIDLTIRPGQRERPYLYSVEANWTYPAEPCAEEGTRATGMRVEVELAEKQTRVIEGERGLRVELTRFP
ncbi:hypothetical protein [Erythrobacter oryzae]|uniref:hypothetical protein n=1 Tax=Erythrobacter oryzae TaxID=3019556 RepID=UPI00255388EF|nr:hypothetical protein [Erythrobacter sp. COR-2]